LRVAQGVFVQHAWRSHRWLDGAPPNLRVVAHYGVVNYKNEKSFEPFTWKATPTQQKQIIRDL
jgi:hypothetical protein